MSSVVMKCNVRGWGCGAMIFAIVAGTASEAHAFAGSVHSSMTKAACAAQHLNGPFCKRVAAEASWVDAKEWDDAWAHAQVSGSLSLCEEANKVIERMSDLGEEYRENLDALQSASNIRAENEFVSGLAEPVGRALHTLQDNYAHHGVSMSEHSWYSLEDFCKGTDNSPDLRPGAEEAARGMTDLLLSSLAPELRSWKTAKLLGSHSCTYFGRVPGRCDPNLQPTPGELCRFLAEAKDWDGIDRQWNADIVGRAMVDAFVGTKSCTYDSECGSDVCAWSGKNYCCTAPGAEGEPCFSQNGCSNKDEVCAWNGTKFVCSSPTCKKQPLPDLCDNANLADPPARPVKTSMGIPTCTMASIICLGTVSKTKSAPVVEFPAEPDVADVGCGGEPGRQHEDDGLPMESLLLPLLIGWRRKRADHRYASPRSG